MDTGAFPTAGYINYDGRVGYATAENNVQIVSNARTWTALQTKQPMIPKAKVLLVELTGNATATQNGNTIGNQSWHHQ